MGWAGKPALNLGRGLRCPSHKMENLIFGSPLAWCITRSAYLVDIRIRRRDGDFAFWLYLFGLMAFWFGITFMGNGSEFQKFIYCLINLGLMLLSVILGRKVFMVFGAIGVFGYLSHLAYSVFEDSLLFPFALTALGILIIYLGVLYQRQSRNLERLFEGLLPQGVRQFFPRE